MTAKEFSDQFDVLYNNITSNQAPGLNEYEKSVFLTKAQDEIIKNYFLPQSNAKQAGYDGNAKRQADFSMLMRTASLNSISQTSNPGSGDVLIYQIDPRSKVFELPEDVFLIINEAAHLQKHYTSGYHGSNSGWSTYFIRQIIPLTYDEYMRLMSKPYKNPLKNQAWKLIVSNSSLAYDSTTNAPAIELILTNTDRNWLNIYDEEEEMYPRVLYVIRYIKKPMPIILTNIDDLGDDLTIGGYNGNNTDDNKPNSTFYTDGKCCELDDSIHEEILQRAVELAKIAWAGNQEELASAQLNMTSGQRSE